MNASSRPPSRQNSIGTGLEPCFDCGETISRSARRCPHCGSTMTPARRDGARVMLVLLIVAGIIGVIAAAGQVYRWW